LRVERPTPPSILTASVSETPLCALLIGVFLEPELLASPAVGVGHEPDAFSAMGSAGVTRSEHAPFCIIPHRGQVPENDVESSACESWDVLHEDVAWFHVANDARHLGPES